VTTDILPKGYKDGKQRVINVGSNKKVARKIYNQVLNVGANNVIGYVTITPPVGELWRVKNITINLPAPTGATTGDHELTVCMGDTTDYMEGVFQIKPTFSTTLTLQNSVASATVAPNDMSALGRAIERLVIANDCPLTLRYRNGTTVVQNNTLKLILVVEVEYVV